MDLFALFARQQRKSADSADVSEIEADRGSGMRTTTENSDNVVNASTERKLVSSTVRDVARLAGVSTTTVSRVVNGSIKVSGETRTRVLRAISRLQYRPNVHATELKRGAGSRPILRSVQVSSSTDAQTKSMHNLAEEPRETCPRKRRSRSFTEERLQVRRVVARLSRELEKLRNIVQ